jgi:hypothetical protein
VREPYIASFEKRLKLCILYSHLPVVVLVNAAAVGDLHPHLRRGASLHRHVWRGVREGEPTTA